MKFIGLYFAAFAALGFVGYRSRSHFFKNASVLLSSLFVVLFAFEAMLAAFDRSEYVPPIFPKGYFVADPQLGYGARPGANEVSRKYAYGRLVYEVRYQFDQNGLRETAGNTAPNADTVAFFGDSFTVGEGVENDQTLPYHVSELTDFGFRVLNLGFHGYGPHQMLRQLETGRVAPLISGRLVRAFYLGIPHHVLRVAGHMTWAFEGPRYELVNGRRAAYQGPFYPRPVAQLIGVALESEALRFGYQKALAAWRRIPGVREQLLETYIGVVKNTAEILDADFGAPLTVLFWPNDDALSSQALEELRRAELEVIDLSEVISPDERDRYSISGDGHPNPGAYRKIARHLVDRFGMDLLGGPAVESSDSRFPAPAGPHPRTGRRHGNKIPRVQGEQELEPLVDVISKRTD